MQLESEVDNQKLALQKVNTESETTVFEIKTQLKREIEKSKSTDEKLENTINELETKDLELKQASAQLKQLSYRLQIAQGDLSEKDVAVKKLMDRSNYLKETQENKIYMLSSIKV